MLAEMCRAAANEIRQDYGFAVPWELIQGLVKWIRSQCLNQRQVFRESAASPSVFQMYRLERRTRRVLRREGFRGDELSLATAATVDTVLSQAADSTPQEMDTVFEEAGGE